MGNINGIVETLITFGIICGLAIWGIFGLVDYFFIFDGIKSKSLITPKIELVIENNKIDTLYVYEKR